MKNWGELPGRFDSINASWTFPASNPYGIPDLVRENDWLPEWLAPYRVRLDDHQQRQSGACHFYLDDYRFEVVWDRPVQTLKGLNSFGAVLTPDFSLYRDWPLAVQLWNTYRNRWLGAFWQSQGLKVIPSVSWSTPQSYDFCFAGLADGGLVSISCQGVGEKEARQLFRSGFKELLQQVRPAGVLCYGEPDHQTRLLAQNGGVELITYPTRWTGIRQALKKQKNSLNDPSPHETPFSGDSISNKRKG